MTNALLYKNYLVESASGTAYFLDNGLLMSCPMLQDNTPDFHVNMVCCVEDWRVPMLPSKRYKLIKALEELEPEPQDPYLPLLRLVGSSPVS